MPNPILDQIEEINLEYEQDDEVDTKVLQDLIETIEVELYERQTLISSLAVSFDNDIDGDAD